jgi:hypothetical protein
MYLPFAPFRFLAPMAICTLTAGGALADIVTVGNVDKV